MITGFSDTGTISEFMFYVIGIYNPTIIGSKI